MEEKVIHYLHEQNILMFLLQILVLLGVAKILGGLFQRWGWPALAGITLDANILSARRRSKFTRLLF